MSCSCSWAAGAHMTKLSADRAGVHGTSMLRMSRGSSLAEGANVLRTLGAYMVHGLTLEAASDGGSGWGFWGVRDNDGVIASSRLHNHLQSSRECNMSSAHSKSALSVNPSPTLLSWSRVIMISFSWKEGVCGSKMVREGVGSSGQLGRRVDNGVGGGDRLGRGGMPGGLRRMGVDSAS